ncbi:hypothetical protein [Cohnella nanjingensis]|uniref:DUF2190 family protein n=1 Tax=Cohnella nanjingensis TaxID=1387779 RepID=A0A7X0VG12_9BACL|nr:hypothetical protein [Cohnella nanjingensis]MBB6672622.1 hypothetical protein [Cohnella nanjingensis]
MARFVRSDGGYNQPTTVGIPVAASQTINVGDIIQITAASGLASAAIASSTTVVGVAQNAITTGASPTAQDIVYIIPAEDNVFRVAYSGTTKTSIAQADLYGTLFNLANKTTVNLDNTTGGMCQIVGYNNAQQTADVVFAVAKKV